MTSNPLIDLLRTYGPSPSSDSQYDEHVHSASKHFGIEEFHIDTPLVGSIGEIITGKTPTNIILTGTAGDGKTYLIRQVITRFLGGTLEDWPGSNLLSQFTLPSGRVLRVIRDLSEFPDDRKESEIAEITECLLDHRKSAIYLIAANDGQLLEMWRHAAEEHGSASAYYRVYSRLLEMLHEEYFEDPDNVIDLKLFNLSRQATNIANSIVADVIGALLEHKSWTDGCDGCSLADDDRRCPIRYNRTLLLSDLEGESSTFLRRLQDIVNIAAANDQPVPLRQIIALVVNIVLGDHKDHDAPLMSCDTARQRSAEDDYRTTNPYDSAVGLNLAPDVRSRLRIFSTMQAMGIGDETTNYFDRLLLIGEPQPIVELLESVDPIYGLAIFESVRNNYRRTPRGRSGQQNFLLALASQRRRLFFQLPHKYGKPQSIWMLTVFQNGALFLEFRDALSVNRHARSLDQQDVVSRSMNSLVQGLNRALTGLMTNEHNELYLATAIGRSDDSRGTVTTVRGIPRGAGWHLFYVDVDFDDRRGNPAITVTSDKIDGFRAPSLTVSPFLFEYLIRVSAGCLPTSFSNLCQHQVKRFAIMVLEGMGASLGATVGPFQTIDLNDDATIKLDEISVTQS